MWVGHSCTTPLILSFVCSLTSAAGVGILTPGRSEIIPSFEQPSRRHNQKGQEEGKKTKPSDGSIVGVSDAVRNIHVILAKITEHRGIIEAAMFPG